MQDEGKTLKPIISARGWIICKKCGDYHRLIPAIGKPAYWCNDELLQLERGETVHIEELH